MSLNFPNPVRSFDAGRSCVSFWGSDASLEIAFQIEIDALRSRGVEMFDTEIELDRPRTTAVAVAAAVAAVAAEGAGDVASTSMAMAMSTDPSPFTCTAPDADADADAEAADGGAAAAEDVTRSTFDVTVSKSLMFATSRGTAR